MKIKMLLAATALVVATAAHANAAVIIVPSGGHSNAARRNNNLSEQQAKPLVADAVVVCPTRSGYVINGCLKSEWRSNEPLYDFHSYAEWKVGRKVEVVGIVYNDYRNRMEIYVRYVGVGHE